MVEIIAPTLFQLKNSLGNLESEIMKIIWLKRKVTVREVLNILKVVKPIAYTTVMTVMDHLQKKNFLKRIKVGKTYYYNPAVSSATAVSNSFSNMVKSLTSDYGRRKVLSTVITFNLIPKITLPIISSYSLPTKYSIFLTLCITFFGLSLYDLYQNLKFYGVLDYFNLFSSEPAIFWDKVHLAIFAIIESLPLYNIFITLISFTVMIYLSKRLLNLIIFPTKASL